MINRKLIPLILIMLVGFVLLSGCEIPITKPVEKTVYIAPYMTECLAEVTQFCLLVKENPEGEYTFFYDQIEGFDYQEGYEYELKIREEIMEDSQDGNSSIKWILIEEINKMPVEQALSHSDIEGKLWQLKTYLNASGSMVDVFEERTITAIFLQGKVEGDAGCNRYFGSYVLDAEKLVFSEIGSTDMFCNEPAGIMDQEADYLEALSKSASYQMNQDQFQVYGANGEILLTYERVVPKPLIGTQWSLEVYMDGNGSYMSILPGTEITTIFNPDYTLEGNSGCNNYTSTYLLEDSALSIGSAAVTRMFCSEPDGIMEQEKAFLAGLENASTYSIEGNTLVILDSIAERILSYVSKPIDLVPTPAPIEGTEEFIGPIWKWVSLAEEGQDQLLIDDPTKYTIEFLPDRTLSVLADCNQAQGTYNIENDQIAIEISTLTTNTCDQGSLSEGFLRLLGDVVKVTSEDVYLFLDLSNDTGQMVFSRAEEITLPTPSAVTATPLPTETPTPAASPTNIPTPAATATPTSTANIIFDDDFSTDTGWMIYDAETHGFRWEKGSYYIYINTLNGYIWSTRTIELSDGTVETAADHIEGDDSGYYGVVCRFQTGTDYYALVINDAGSYGIARMQYGLLEFISQGTDQSGIIKRDGELNTIRGDCVGDTLTLYVNGEKLSEVKDSSFTGGTVGIIAITFNKKISVVLYDRFTVYER